MSSVFQLPVKYDFMIENADGSDALAYTNSDDGIVPARNAEYAIHAINQHDKLVEAIRLFLAYNDATDDDDDVAMMLMYADALKAAREAIACESE